MCRSSESATTFCSRATSTPPELRRQATIRRMFTGIVRELGRIVSVDGTVDGVRIVVEAPETAGDANVGDSVSINGVCLTVTDTANGTVAFDAVPETLRRSSLGGLGPGEDVNVEPALRAGEPLGGHYVQGHVDGVGGGRRNEPEGDGPRG